MSERQAEAPVGRLGLDRLLVPGPARPRFDILPVEQRLPRRPEGPSLKDLPTPDRSRLDDLRKAMYEQRDARMAEFAAQRQEWLERRAEESRQRAAKNTEYAREMQRRFLKGAVQNRG
ncbi:hypothetical protein [Streptomyces sp. NPDC127197]|uniref:hypothetical protein n=1 Tax=Streptomyces sp. NPDC127197 TaxID=3345388 RepID=UPI00362B44D6